jgi:glycosyltransferase involved in cell wall biosynthesis
MRVLIVHVEALGCAGAQRVLSFFLQGASEIGLEVELAMAPNAIPVHDLPSNQRFTIQGLLRQILALRGIQKRGRFDLLHGWTARDWELTTCASRLLRRPGMGSLHEHPRAGHITTRRQSLMRLCGRRGLARVLCVSEAVAAACRAEGYPESRLVVVRNGIPSRIPPPAPPPVDRPEGVRLGYLGILDESKGLATLLHLADALHEGGDDRWTLRVAGGAVDESGEAWVRALQSRYAARPWWPRVEWLGWVQPVAGFFESIDLLVMPSTAFDAFPTVLLEAGEAARPAFASNIGGVPEILADGETGWIFSSSDLASAANRLRALVREPRTLAEAGNRAAERIRRIFPVERMTRGYIDAYETLLRAARPRG